MKSVIGSCAKFFIIVVILASSFASATAESGTLNRRVAVVNNGAKTSIWVSDFPKKTSVVIMDSENNLLSIVSTNDYGAAYVSLPSNNTVIIAKTLDGEIVVSNKAVVDSKAANASTVSNSSHNSHKA